jgi:hypothetical protein
MFRLRKDRKLTALLENGRADVKLYDTRNTSQVVWINNNSYVCMESPQQPPAGSGDWPVMAQTVLKGERKNFRIVSVNGMGEVRWTIDPNQDYMVRDDERAAIEYFLVEDTFNTLVQESFGVPDKGNA